MCVHPVHLENQLNEAECACKGNPLFVPFSHGEATVPVSQRIWTPLDLDPLRGFGPPTKLSENIVLNVLVKMDDTLRSSAY